MTERWDLFFSYRRSELERAQPLLEALERVGVQVWRDEVEIGEQGAITAEIRLGIAGSRAMLAFFSRKYLESGPCQQELTAGWLAAEALGGEARERVWVVNPEEDYEHVPGPLKDQNSRYGVESAGALAEKLKARLDGLDGSLLGGRERLRDAQYRGMSPVQARRFEGRAAELWELHGKLTANRHAVVTGVYGQGAAHVRGLAGNGKTLLAREYAIRFGAAYPGGVFWLNAYGNDDRREAAQGDRLDQVAQFAADCGVRTDGLKPLEVERAFWSTLAARGERCLWIVDDLASGLTQEEIEREWMARWPGASTLVTTRSRRYGGVGEVLDLGVLARGEALRLLCARRKPGGEEERRAAERIVELLGCHPLAVDVAGSYLARGYEMFVGYARALEDPAREDAVEWGAALEESLPTGHEKSISATLVKSLRQLGEEGLDFLRLAAVVAAAPIPRSLVEGVWRRIGAGGGSGRDWVVGVDQAFGASLCERAGELGWTVHGLASWVLRSGFGGDDRRELVRLAAVGVLREIVASVEHAGEHGRIALEIPHARELVAGKWGSAEEAWLALWVAKREFERGEYGVARRLEERVVAVRRRVLGEEHPGTLTSISNLAETLRAQGDLVGARGLQEQVLAVRRRVLGEEHTDTLTSMNNLAEMLRAQGDLAPARKLHEQVLAVRRRVLGEEHTDTLTSMSNLAVTRGEQGDLAPARKLQEQVLAVRRRVLGEVHPDTLTSMNNLAGRLWEQGDLAGARGLQEQVLAVRRRVLGEEHPGTLTSISNLAETLRAQGDLAAARKLQEQVLAVRQRVLGEEHPDTLRSMSNLGLTLQRQGDLAGARGLQEDVLAVRRRVLGEGHPDTLTSMNNLAETLRAQGDLSGARGLQEQVLAVRQRVLGEEHPDTLRSMHNLAYTLWHQGERARALALWEHATEGLRRVLGAQHPDTIVVEKSLAVARSDAQGGLGMAVGRVGRRVLNWLKGGQ